MHICNSYLVYLPKIITKIMVILLLIILLFLSPPSDGAVCFEERIEKCISNLRYELQQLNGEMEDHIKHLLHAAVNNITADVRYQFLEGHGPRRTTISPAVPFTQRYFVHVGGSSDLSGAEIEGSKGRNVVAHNGWVMNADPLVNFAEEGSEVRGCVLVCV